MYFAKCSPFTIIVKFCAHISEATILHSGDLMSVKRLWTRANRQMRGGFKCRVCCIEYLAHRLVHCVTRLVLYCHFSIV